MASLAAINAKLAKAERALAESERTGTPEERLHRIASTTDDLLLAQDLLQFRRTAEKEDSMSNEVRNCERMAELLSKHNPKGGFYQRVYEEEFLPWMDYLQGELVLSFRQGLRNVKYPSKDGCDRLLGDSESLNSMAEARTLHALLHAGHRQLLHHMEGSYPPEPELNPLVKELCRPFVERCRYHFVQESKDRPSTQRIDRLPELLLGYCREHVLEGPWKIVQRTLDEGLAADFLNEVIRVVQWVLMERHFFQDESIVGPNSNPMTLSSAIEQFLLFDQRVTELAGGSRVMSLMDVFVVGDGDLLSWWLTCERDSAMRTLYEDGTPSGIQNYIHPKAELFCSLIRSIQLKASVFSFSGPYLAQVAGPLCSQLVESLQEAASDLRRAMSKRQMPSDEKILSNVECWIGLINGTRLCATQILSEPVGTEQGALDDLVRFGHSLEELESVLAQEFVQTFVETLIMEKAKFASYLMRCSYILSSNEMEDSHDGEMEQCTRLLGLLFRSCSEIEVASESHSLSASLMMYAPQRLRDAVLESISLKLIDVALDTHGMTPDLVKQGGITFKRNVANLFAQSVLPESSLRLVDIAEAIAMDGSSLASLGDALCGLANEAPPLTADMFLVDETIFDQAMSMIRAKGLLWIALDDVLSVLNRRRDLGAAELA